MISAIPAMHFHEVRRLLPHDPPWILVDRVLRVENENFIEVQKAISGSDPLLASHFPHGPSVYPGVLLIELVGQAARLLEACVAKAAPKAARATGVLVRCKASFKSPAYAGDLLTVRVERIEQVGSACLYHGSIFCGDRRVCQVELLGASIEEVNEACQCDTIPASF